MTRLTRDHRALTAWSALCLGCGVVAELLLRSF